MVRFSRVGLAVCLMGYPLWRWPLAWRSHREGNILKDQAYGERMGVSPRNSGECAFFFFKVLPGEHLARSRALFVLIPQHSIGCSTGGGSIVSTMRSP